MSRKDYHKALDAQQRSTDSKLQYSKLISDIQGHFLTDTQLAKFVFKQIAIFFTSVVGVYLSLEYLIRGFQAEQRNALRRIIVPEFPTRVIGHQCPICLEDINDLDLAVGHNVNGGIATHSFHLDCLEEYSDRRGNLSVLSAQCPYCRQQPMVARTPDQLDQIMERAVRNQSSFGQYVMQKTVYEPLSKMTNALTRGSQQMVDLVRRRYMAVPSEEPDIELGNLIHDHSD